jgi:hypothetical protein
MKVIVDHTHGVPLRLVRERHRIYFVESRVKLGTERGPWGICSERLSKKVAQALLRDLSDRGQDVQEYRVCAYVRENEQ